MAKRGPAETFILIAALSGLAWAILWHVITDDSKSTSATTGFVVGIAFGAIGAYKLSDIEIVHRFLDRGAYLARLDDTLAALDLTLASETGNFRVYQSQAQGSFSLGPVGVPGLTKRVRVQLSDNTATLVGPRSLLQEPSLAGLAAR